ncbi:MAG: 3-dehydroquinate synthase [Bacteroidetes bacterium]|nr:MAG: 3-dehydroquinate synthase [Bacteroidota bacterium]REK08014.1 MAG: 3-dehydroquinate synthase [Bacteroidota bacterium]REK32219.1 MAG: 3-dehydroquinate synthase [Bacteroidota bacterium]REK47371.1 MAG: 3-dehydroquinate synthase [Bacteroidota bacterium]
MSEISKLDAYNIYTGDDSLKHLDRLVEEKYKNSKLFILVDENTRVFCLSELIRLSENLNDSVILEFSPGDSNKSLRSCSDLWKRLSDNHADRNSLLINLGGGVVTDLGGFVASVFMRGIDYLNIPTSLLGMVDSALGGKTGINYYGYKNMIGTFSNPVAVFINPVFLKTLPERELKSGFAEIIKHALIQNKSFWSDLHEVKDLSQTDFNKLISKSVKIKSHFVEEDFLDRGSRRALNFGHTVGHALESYSILNHEEPVRHGEAVAIGMLAESYISTFHSGLPSEQFSEIQKMIISHFKYLQLEASVDKVMSIISADKKNENSSHNFSLLTEIGAVVINQQPPENLILESVDFALSLFRQAHSIK